MTPFLQFDMDGVVANFTGGALKVHNKSLPPGDITWDWPSQVGFKDANDPEFWKPIENVAFWHKLDLLMDGYRLFQSAEYVFKQVNIGFLTDASRFGAGDGKRMWLQRYFPSYADKVVMAKRKELVACARMILIDDNDKNCKNFIEAGGKAILVPRPWNERRKEANPNGTFDHNKIMGEIITLARSMV